MSAHRVMHKDMHNDLDNDLHYDLHNDQGKTNVQCKDKDNFKIFTKNQFKPNKYKYFSRGSKLGHTLLTRIRVGRSYLNEHGFTIVMTEHETPQCFFIFEVSPPYTFF